MIDIITKGYQVQIRPGSVTLISLKDGAMPDPFPSVPSAADWVHRMAAQATDEIVQAMAKRQGAA